MYRLNKQQSFQLKSILKQNTPLFLVPSLAAQITKTNQYSQTDYKTKINRYQNVFLRFQFRDLLDSKVYTHIINVKITQSVCYLFTLKLLNLFDKIQYNTNVFFSEITIFCFWERSHHLSSNAQVSPPMYGLPIIQ